MLGAFSASAAGDLRRRSMKKATLATKKAPTITLTAIPAFSAVVKPLDDPYALGLAFATDGVVGDGVEPAGVNSEAVTLKQGILVENVTASTKVCWIH